uniref:uroporphyrinogen-III C-methyltransferase n=1 Tax=Eubacterium cellulosolvens TaxID=29322 RepID=UPI000482203B|nr:uroporphyrinogen-III C-methyltransferase [[Eubacterium] cellulosolvens]
MTGKVWLVGAGPGDAGLFTLRGKEVLESADVVVYDALVGKSILNMIPERAELIFAGKRSGNHFLKQEETNRVLLEEARKGKNVVRLKGGDPFVFGRGGEELELLAEYEIPFEVVPGVTSAFAVPAYNGIPVTHRDFCSGVHIITGHRRRDHSYDIDFDALVRTRGTLIFLMGIAALPDICAGLLHAGMDPQTPSAVLEKGTTADQRRISAPLANLVKECKAQAVETPAIIVVGDVCALSEKFFWYEKKPLAGVRLIVTRPKESVSRLSGMLRQKGAEVWELPSIATEPLTNTTAFQKCLLEVAGGSYDWMVFTSPAGVRIFFDAFLEKQDARTLYRTRIAVIGRGTRNELGRYGLHADFVPSYYDGETLGKELAGHCKPGERVLISRAKNGNPALTVELNKVDGLKIKDLPIYETVYVKSRVIDERAAIEKHLIDFAVFTSASTVKGFVNSVGDIDYSGLKAICIGNQTAEEARKHNMKTYVAEKATLEALVDCVEKTAAELRLT